MRSAAIQHVVRCVAAGRARARGRVRRVRGRRVARRAGPGGRVRREGDGRAARVAALLPDQCECVCV